MQDMSNMACASAGEGGSKQLIDNRDGKSYWVTKLKGGQCWMTQNLDLDLSNKILTPDDTDILENWTPTAITQVGTPSFSGSGSPVQSYDPGDKYCPNGSCATTSDNGDAHYSQGNYYSWAAATAGTGNASVTVAGTTVSSSICPKGWMLPADGAYSGLLTQYGLQSTPTSGSYSITGAPLYFVCGGHVNNSSLSNAGSNGYYWSSTANSSTAAYYLDFSSRFVSPSNNSSRYLGLSVRCVAR